MTNKYFIKFYYLINIMQFRQKHQWSIIVWVLRFKVWASSFKVLGLGFRVWTIKLKNK